MLGTISLESLGWMLVVAPRSGMGKGRARGYMRFSTPQPLLASRPFFGLCKMSLPDPNAASFSPIFLGRQPWFPLV